MQCRNPVILLLYLCVFLPVCVCCTASEHAFLSSQRLLGNKVVLHGGVDLHHKRAKTELHTLFKRNCSSFLYFHLKCVLHNWSILLFSSHHDFSFTSHTLQVSPAQYCLDVREHCSSQCAHWSSHRRAGSCVSMYWNVNPPSNMMRYAAMHLNAKNIRNIQKCFVVHTFTSESVSRYLLVSHLIFALEAPRSRVLNLDFLRSFQENASSGVLMMKVCVLGASLDRQAASFKRMHALSLEMLF